MARREQKVRMERRGKEGTGREGQKEGNRGGGAKREGQKEGNRRGGAKTEGQKGGNRRGGAKREGQKGGNWKGERGTSEKKNQNIMAKEEMANKGMKLLKHTKVLTCSRHSEWQ